MTGPAEEQVMNKRSFDPNEGLPVANGAARRIARGVCRLLGDMGYATMLEFKLRSRRQVDVMGLDREARFVIVEVKSSLGDFRADRKWPDYLDYCDLFYFAVDCDFPVIELPAECGVIVADFYSAAVLRPASEQPLNGARRRAQTLRFAISAAERLGAALDRRI